ncbi:uncharacterized protein F4807DRAFT_220656 [Annulohypoxylon truncatum]|uniref:uncharacterized protein n=1 Tax=Annulohypoxylon truncatum TaxID=327061 RepID=UPI002007B765|nr:uncharacterized protein F4807DRAFT_220656 [Annulohypoxylon truncatum]KAI1206695.1 hypothetical protein F4807DRAFT_220656 [Annulohypoxylon truncatum]
MPCTCKRLTIRYACRHKEREFDRCWRYQFKKDFPCLGMIVSNCEAHVTHTTVPRVCRRCFEFFLGAFGRKAAYHVSKKFLEFKGNNGLSREVIDPATVPPEAYISSAELATLDSTTAYWSGQPIGQPFHPRSPMRATSYRDLPSADIQQPEPVVHRKRHGDRRPSRSKSRSKSAKASRKKPIPRKPVPGQGKISKRDISKPILPIPTGGSDFESFPVISDNTVVEYGTNEPIDLSDLVENENDNDLDYELIYHGRVSNRFPHQPLPIRLKPVSKEPHPQASSSSLVKRITKAAETTRIMGYPNPEHKDLPSVPKLGKAPKVPAWRVESPSPEPSTTSEDSKGKSKKGRSKSAIPLSRTRDLSPVPRLPAPATATTTETYLVRGRTSSELLTRPRATSLSDTLRISLPPRTAGLKNFREKGIPSAAFLLEENFGEQVQAAEDSPTVLVSVSTPSPAYSCAVQSCYCSQGDDAQVCPSCLERRRLEPELQSKWL